MQILVLLHDPMKTITYGTLSTAEATSIELHKTLKNR